MNFVYTGSAAIDPKKRNPPEHISRGPKEELKPFQIQGIRDSVIKKQDKMLIMYDSTPIHPFPLPTRSASCQVLAKPEIRLNVSCSDARLYSQSCRESTGWSQTNLKDTTIFYEEQLLPEKALKKQEKNLLSNWSPTTNL